MAPTLLEAHVVLCPCGEHVFCNPWIQSASLCENIIESIGSSSLSKTFGISSGGLFVRTSRKGVHPVPHHFSSLLRREIGESLSQRLPYVEHIRHAALAQFV